MFLGLVVAGFGWGLCDVGGAQRGANRVGPFKAKFEGVVEGVEGSLELAIARASEPHPEFHQIR